MTDSHRGSESWTNVSRSSSLLLTEDKTNEPDPDLSESSGDEATSPYKKTERTSNESQAPPRRLSLDSKESTEERGAQAPESGQAADTSPRVESSNTAGRPFDHLIPARLVRRSIH